MDNRDRIDVLIDQIRVASIWRNTALMKTNWEELRSYMEPPLLPPWARSESERAAKEPEHRKYIGYRISLALKDIALSGDVDTTLFFAALIANEFDGAVSDAYHATKNISPISGTYPEAVVDDYQTIADKLLQISQTRNAWNAAARAAYEDKYGVRRDGRVIYYSPSPPLARGAPRLQVLQGGRSPERLIYK